MSERGVLPEVGPRPAEPSEDHPEVFQLQRSLALMSAAEAADAELTYREAAIAVGEESQGRAFQAVQAVKRWLPFTRSYDQKMAGAIDLQHTEARQENAERDTVSRLSSWVEGLLPDARERVEVIDESYGEDYITPLQLRVKTGASDEPQTFRLGHSFDLSLQPGLSEQLPKSVSHRLKDRQQFWNGLGVTTGEALEGFLDEHLEKIPVTITEAVDQPEMQWLQAAHPETFDDLQAVQKDGDRELIFWRLKKTPDSVVDYALNVAVNSQHSFITTWLPDWMIDGLRPTIIPADTEKLQAKHERISQATARKSSPDAKQFRHRLMQAALDERLATETDFDSCLENVEHLRWLTLSLTIEGETDAYERAVLNRVNESLDGELSGEKATERLMIDTVLRTSEGLRQSLLAIAALVPGAEAMQQVPIPAISESAKAFGSADDPISEAGEIKSLLAQGVTWPELTRRFAVILPVAVGAVALGTQIDHIGQSAGERVAATAYAVSAFMTAATTLGLTTKTFTRYYRELADEGKLQAKPYLSTSAREGFHEAVTEARSVEEAQAAATAILGWLRRVPNMDQAMLDNREQAIFKAIQAGRFEQAAAQLSPTSSEALSAAYAEVFGANAYRKGKLAAMPVMLGAAAAMGGALFISPALYVPFGASECLSGLGFAKFADVRESSRWKKKVRQYTAQASADHTA